MQFSVPCYACGKRLLVSEGAAGAHLQCECGWEVMVPDLLTLRQQAGLPSHEARPAELIAHLVNVGELPEGRACAGCGQDTDEVVETVAQCERLWSHDPGDTNVALAWLVHWALPLLVKESEERVFNRGLAVPVPLRLCKGCQGPLGPSVLLWAAGFLKLLCGISAVLVLFFVPWLGAGLLAVALLAWGTERAVRRRRQATARRLLRRVPLYDRLLEDYPNAVIVDPDEKLVLG
ncbi:MAG: hypothetical protein HYS12_17160 [Planctomycetes bacterium]|nr:hypothetical protein [Planctomycetota bacterium]